MSRKSWSNGEQFGSTDKGPRYVVYEPLSWLDCVAIPDGVAEQIRLREDPEALVGEERGIFDDNALAIDGVVLSRLTADLAQIANRVLAARGRGGNPQNMAALEVLRGDKVCQGLTTVDLAGCKEALSRRYEEDVVVDGGALGSERVARLEEGGEEWIQGKHSSRWNRSRGSRGVVMSRPRRAVCRR